MMKYEENGRESKLLVSSSQKMGLSLLRWEQAGKHWWGVKENSVSNMLIMRCLLLNLQVEVLSKYVGLELRKDQD